VAAEALEWGTGVPDGLDAGAVGAGAGLVGAGAGAGVVGTGARRFGDAVAAGGLRVGTDCRGATPGSVAGSLELSAAAGLGTGESPGLAKADGIGSLGKASPGTASPGTAVCPATVGGGPDIATASGMSRAAPTPPAVSSKPMARNATRDQRRRGLRCCPVGI
jgi:hypothetical protein